jgi:2-polyprenyl-6-methoxyphenol hydroxylase-like FAD-dependent oxidoreductase
VDRESDVIIVGGGIAGASLATVLARNGVAVTLLERQQKFQDLVRGEFLGTWGVAEAGRLGLTDCLLDAGAWPLRWWRQWDETVHPDDAALSDLSPARGLPGLEGLDVEGPVTISHPATCDALARAARTAGAQVVFGAEGISLDLAGAHPVLHYRAAGKEQTQACRIVVGAGGRNGQIARQSGINLDVGFSSWGGGLAVDGLTDWPSDTQALGTEGGINFIILPQGGGRARLYFNTDAETAKQFTGPDKAQKLLRAFDLKCVPGSEEISSARPIGRLSCFPGTYSWTDSPVADGVVLIGDEAGMNATILGTGLANSLRDVRQVSEVLLGQSDWSPAAFREYGSTRGARMQVMHRAAHIMTRLYAEFDDAARMRRQRAYELIRQNNAYAIFMYVTLAGPDVFPGGPFGDYLVERLLAAA